MANFHGVWSVAGIVGALYAAAVAQLDIPLTWSLGAVAVIALIVTLAARPHFVDAREVAVDLSGGDRVVPWRPILVIGLAVLVFYAADTGILAWSSKYLHDALDASKSIAPLAFAAYEAGALISRFGGDFLVRRHGAVPVVRMGTIIGIAGLIGVVAAPVPGLAILGFFFAGLGLAILATLAFAAIGGAVGPDGADVAIARLNIADYLGAILGSGLIGAAATGGRLLGLLSCHSPSYRSCWSSRSHAARPTRRRNAPRKADLAGRIHAFAPNVAMISRTNRCRPILLGG